MSAPLHHSPVRDQAWGRYYARQRAARILHEAVLAPSREERLARYYADLSAAHDFHPVAHASRAARGLALIRAGAQRCPASAAPIHKPRKRAQKEKA